MRLRESACWFVLSSWLCAGSVGWGDIRLNAGQNHPVRHHRAEDHPSARKTHYAGSHGMSGHKHTSRTRTGRDLQPRWRVLESKSAIAPLLKEPVLEGTWYSQEGPDPVFTNRQKNGSVVKVQLGYDALMDCWVTSLEKNLVSWFLMTPTYSTNSSLTYSLNLLTVGFQTYSSDYRYLLDFQRPNNYRLRVRDVKLSDRGYYHCQLATHPPQIIWTLLQIDNPIVSITDGENSTVQDIHHHIGSKISIHCLITKAPRLMSSVIWTFHGGGDSHGTTVLNEAVERGGIMINTRRVEQGKVLSHLEMVDIRLSDAGNYTCSLPDKLAGIAFSSVRLHVVAELPEPVINSAQRSSFPAFSNISTWTIVVLVACKQSNSDN